MCRADFWSLREKRRGWDDLGEPGIETCISMSWEETIAAQMMQDTGGCLGWVHGNDPEMDMGWEVGIHAWEPMHLWIHVNV